MLASGACAPWLLSGQADPGLAVLSAATAASVGANVLSKVMTDGVERLHDDPAEVDTEQVQDWLEGRFTQLLEAGGEQARVLEAQLALLLDEVEAGPVAMAEAVRLGHRETAEQMRIGLAELAGVRSRLEDLHITADLIHGDVRSLLERPGRSAPGHATGPAGWPLAEVTSPFDFLLEVHRAIDAAGAGAAGLPELPVYVPREHDRPLGEAVAQAAGGASQMRVLVGGSSTGKTRACWEALQPLREAGGWRLWHPIAPAPPDALLADLARVGPRTVLWLNEAQLYLNPTDPALGERVASGVRELLRDTARAPVLVLASLWPRYWTALTGSSLHAQARELLDGRKIEVPDAFTGSDLQALSARAATDPRLKEAAERGGHEITQYLAGVPILMDRYTTAPAATQALIHAAIDARRLGCGPRLPLALLTQAAQGYLTEPQWDLTFDDWLQRALQHCAPDSDNGIPGILIPVKTEVSRGHRRPATGPLAGAGPLVRLADYLEQAGTRERLDKLPPPEFWEAARRHAAPGDLPALAQQAERRGLYRQGALLRMRALADGEDLWVFRLVALLHLIDPDGLPGAVGWIADRMDLSRPARVHAVLESLGATGRADLAGPLAARAAHRAGLTDLRGVDDLLRDLHRFGRGEALAALADRAAGQVDPAHRDLHLLYQTLRKTGAVDAVRTLIARDPFSHFSDRDLFDRTTFMQLLWLLRGEGPGNPIMAAHAVRAARSIDLTQTSKVCSLLDALAKHGFGDALAVLLASWPADQVDINDPNAVDLALKTLSSAGELDACQALAERAAGQAALSLALLRVLRQRAGAAADRLAGRYAAKAPVDDPRTRYALASLHHSGTPASVAGLAQRLADSVDPADIRAVAGVLASLREVGMDGLLRDRLDQVSLSRYESTNPAEVAFLLRTLSATGADQLVRKLLNLNPVATLDVSDGHAVTVLIDLLEGLGDPDAAASLENLYASQQLATDPKVLTGQYLNSDYPPTSRMLARLTSQHAQTIVLTDASAVAGLISGFRIFGIREALTVVLDRLTREPLDLTDAGAVLSRLSSLPDTSEGRAAAERICHDSATQVKFTGASTLAHIIGQYRQLGCSQAILDLLARDPAGKVGLTSRSGAAISSTVAGRHSGQEVRLDEGGIKSLIDALRQAGAQDQADLLAKRGADAGMFAYWPQTTGMFLNRDTEVTLLSLLDRGLEPPGRYRYGRDPNGEPSGPWGWQDLLRDEESLAAELAAIDAGPVSDDTASEASGLGGTAGR